MNKFINNLKFEISWGIQKAIEKLEYHKAIFLLNLEDWYNLITSKDIYSSSYTYGNFWNGALDLDINVYNRFLD